jgi:asparagine synthase (glutamine-hydrolysing)
MQNLLPPEIIQNRKQGFSAPDQSWYMQQLVEYIRSIVLSDRSLDRGYLQRAYLERVLEDHVAGRANNRLLIWSLLSFEWWNRIFVDGESVECRDSENRAAVRSSRPAQRVPVSSAYYR